MIAENLVNDVVVFTGKLSWPMKVRSAQDHVADAIKRSFNAQASAPKYADRPSSWLPCYHAPLDSELLVSSLLKSCEHSYTNKICADSSNHRERSVGVQFVPSTLYWIIGGYICNQGSERRLYHQLSSGAAPFH